LDATARRAIAIVGLGALLPDAPGVPEFWHNLCAKRYSITEVPPERWSAADYYDPDPKTPDKTYSKIGSWVRGFSFDWKTYRLPPRVVAAMDETQQWAVTMSQQALTDYGLPGRTLDLERTGVIMGTVMGGELHYHTSLRVYMPEYVHALESASAFSQLPVDTRQAILAGWQAQVAQRMPPITEDSMPGELANIVSGRVANALNLNGPNFITDAACASSFASVLAAVELLENGQCDAVLAGGVDRNMGPSMFVKFCKIGALSATGTRPFGDGADGFVMGEGGAVFLLKRLADAEAAGDRIYAVIRGIAGSSDGRGKGITAPNPRGQQLAIRRAWEDAGLDPATATLVEAHGTSTRVGDVVEVEALAQVFGRAPHGRIALGSVKSNIGHLKAGAGAAGLLKATLALSNQVLPPTLHAERPNPNIDFSSTPFYLNHGARAWDRPADAPRRAGVSAYGFGGTNFHLVLEEHVPGLVTGKRSYPGFALADSQSVAGATLKGGTSTEILPGRPSSGSSTLNMQASPARPPLRGLLALGAADMAGLAAALDQTIQRVQGGWTPPIQAPEPATLAAAERLVVDFGDQGELLERAYKAQRALTTDNPAAWKALAAQGIFRGHGPQPGEIAFLFPGQGSQYLNMGRELAAREPIVAQVFAEADEIMAPILGKPLSSYIYIDTQDPAVIKRAEMGLMDTAITQPAMLAMDIAIYKLLATYGMRPAIVMGHSLGEYAALIAAGVLPFADALEAVAARGREMTRITDGDNGWMAAVMAPQDVVESTLAGIDGYVVAANINSRSQCVIGGASKAVEQAIARFQELGFDARRIPVSHAFHTKIVAPASQPLRAVLNRLRVAPAQLPVIANITGDFYPSRASIEQIKDILVQQVASPVQWVKGIETLYAAGVRTFVEVGPKKALKGFTDDLLGDRPDVVSLFTNHPKTGEIASMNQALGGLYAAGYAAPAAAPAQTTSQIQNLGGAPESNRYERQMMDLGNGAQAPEHDAARDAAANGTNGSSKTTVAPDDAALTNPALGHLLAQALQHLAAGTVAGQATGPAGAPANAVYDRNAVPQGSVVITGTGLGLPGADKAVMDPDNALRILRGEQFVDLIPERFRRRLLAKRVTRVVKAADGSGSFETITDPDDVIRLAGRAGSFDLAEEYGVPEKLIEALDITSQLAIAAGLDALREAGIPLVQTWKYTSTGKYLPERWLLPEALRDETGVIFASAFPGGDRMAGEFERYFAWQNRLDQLALLDDLRQYTTDSATLRELSRRAGELRAELEREPYVFDRRFIFRVLAMGHSQFAEYIGARGPNTQVNAACASTTQAMAVAEDWIRSGRCRRVIVIGADDVTSDQLIEWVGAGFLATGAAATDDRVEEAALPFDRRRHGTIMGMGACGLVVESEDAVRERGMRGITELLSSETGNSAFHGTRLDVNHIAQVMDRLVTAAELRFGVNRYDMAGRTVFMSHETFTPARGGSASAEVAALRQTFGAAANEIIMANTKGFTGHPMGVGVEDVIATKILEYGIVPPVPNFKELDPELGHLHLSRGGRYPVQYAIHLAAGFGSQLAMTLARRIPGSLERVDEPARYRRWLVDVSGQERAETEVVKRVLRIKAHIGPGDHPAPSTWRYGMGPAVRAAAPGANTYQSSVPAVALTPRAVGYPALPVHAPAPQAGSRDGAPVYTPAAPPRPAVHPPIVREPERPAPEPVASPAAPVAAEVPVAPPPDLRIAEPAPVPAVPAAAPVDAIAGQVLAIVAEKTGYPQDMLDPELDLEADLGVDTVKQAETFVAIRSAFSIPQQENLRLRDYPTLASVIGFVKTMRPDLIVVTPAYSSPSPTAQKVDEPVQTPAAQPMPAPAVAPFAALDPVAGQVLAIVAEKTGYPQDMLDPDLDLEADLGVDTVKQAETFVAIRKAFDIPQQENLKLRDYPTLAKVIGFVHTMRPDLTVTAPTYQAQSSRLAAPAPAPQVLTGPAVTLAGPASDPVAEQVLAIVAEKTGYPQDMLDLDLDLEADLGVDTVKQAETFVAIRKAFDIPQHENLRLRDYPTLAKVIGFVHTMRPDLVATPAPAAVGSIDKGPDDGGPRGGGTTALPPAPEVAPAADAVVSQVLAIVADKTGYPQDMLDLDLDLEADLGVDTVKQAETFVAIRKAFDIPQQENLKLRDYPTLAKVIGFVRTMRPDLANPGPALSPSPSPEYRDGEPAPDAVTELPPVAQPASMKDLSVSLAAADRLPRRVPTPALRPPLDLCHATGVNLAGSRIIVGLDQGGVGSALVAELEAAGAAVLAVEASLAANELTKLVQGWRADGPVTGVYWLPALDIEQNLSDLDLPGWRKTAVTRVKNLYTLMRTLYDAISAPGTFLVAATRLGGLHGYGPEGATAPMGGAVTGFTKAYKRERPDVLVKAVDFAAGVALSDLASALLAETLADPGVVEVGYHMGERYTVTLVEEPAADGRPGLALGRDSVFMVTGAAGGITSAITADLAGASGGTFYLLDLVPEPSRDDPQIALFRQDREALKQHLITTLKAAGERATPAKIEKQILAVERSEAALRAIEAVEAAGGTVHYYNANLLDAPAIQAVFDAVGREHGRLDVLMHAGGLEISRSLSDKEAKEFDLVFDVKAEGFFNLLHAAADLPIGASVVFSSVAGRFGNSGQADYSAANDLLCKVTSSLRRWRPATRGIAIDWTAWGGIGMATRGSIPKIMEMAGIDMLPPEVGIPTVRRELTCGGRSGELVVGGRLGVLGAEWDAAGGIDPARAVLRLAGEGDGRPVLPMIGQVQAAPLYGPILAESTIDPQAQPFLYDHQLEGTPLLPGVMGLETFAELASLLAPDHHVAAVQNAQFLSPFKFYRHQSRTLRLTATGRPAGDGNVLVQTTLTSLTQPVGAAAPQLKVHFTAEVQLAGQPMAEIVKSGWLPPAPDRMDIDAPAIYKVYFHGPAYQVLERAIVEGDSATALISLNLPPDTAAGEGSWLLAPRLIESCFQTAGLWQIRTQGIMALPQAVASARAYRPLMAAVAAGRRLYACVTARAGGASFDAEVVDDSGAVYVTVQGYYTIPLPGTVHL
jgi:malonyl CoA-acyl carrier protein transacylase